MQKTDQKRKNSVTSFYKIMLPVKYADNVRVLVITAENFNPEMTTADDVVYLNEVYLIKKEGPTSRQVTAKQSAAVGLKPGNVETSTITIREMLTGVNDYYGQPFINEDGTGNYPERCTIFGVSVKYYILYLIKFQPQFIATCPIFLF